MTMGVVWNCLAYANSCVNPIIYNYTCKDFRSAFRSVVRGCCSYGCVQTDEIREVNDRDEADDVNDDDNDYYEEEEEDAEEPAIELQLHTDVRVVGHLRPVGCNRPKAVPVVRLETSCTADICSV